LKDKYGQLNASAIVWIYFMYESSLLSIAFKTEIPLTTKITKLTILISLDGKPFQRALHFILVLKLGLSEPLASNSKK
jgi:hypothetical protein